MKTEKKSIKSNKYVIAMQFFIPDIEEKLKKKLFQGETRYRLSPNVSGTFLALLKVLVCRIIKFCLHRSVYRNGKSLN